MNGNIVEYYGGERIRISFDKKKDGYWLSIGENNFFMDERTYSDVSREKGVKLIDKIGQYNYMIVRALVKETVKASNLEKAFSEVRRKENNQMIEFRQSRH